MILKPEYKNQIVKVRGAKGLITFDTNKAKESEYHLYSTLGFDFCFEPAEPTYREPIAYEGIEQEGNLIKLNKKKNAKKVKTETEKE